ncbi:MAG: tRNA dihydrouridine(20/20a) synthase DusA [Lysobacteraceae bacterium]
MIPVAMKEEKVETSASYEAWRVSVAPMMDWTDRHCRAFHRVLAPGARLYTEMVHAHAVMLGDRQRLLGFDASEHPVALQLGGSEPELLAQAARVGAEWGYDEINLNVGCPSDRVQAGRFGACLMREPALVAECVAAMRAVVDVPVTVKCRLGVDEQEEYDTLRDFIDTVAAAGCDTFIVHARKAWLKGLSPKENREVPPLRHELVHRLKRERPQLRILINGGIAQVGAALEQLQHVDGVMLGRAAYHDPYVLHRLDAALAGTPLRSREELLLAYLPYVRAQCAQGVAVKHIGRHVLGLFHGQPGGRLFRQVLSQGGATAGTDAGLIERALDAVRQVAQAA